MQIFYVILCHTCIPVALNLAGKQSEAANLLKHLAENAVTENRYYIIYCAQAR